jgi:hypothetical protein
MKIIMHWKYVNYGPIIRQEIARSGKQANTIKLYLFRNILYGLGSSG